MCITKKVLDINQIIRKDLTKFFIEETSQKESQSKSVSRSYNLGHNYQSGLKINELLVEEYYSRLTIYHLNRNYLGQRNLSLFIPLTKVIIMLILKGSHIP